VASWRRGAEELSQGKRKVGPLGYTQESHSDIDSVLNLEGFALTELRNSSIDSSDDEDRTYNRAAANNEMSNFKTTLKKQKAKTEMTMQPVMVTRA
jgi:hypothetical protein